jgi:hypothetical protein
MYHVPLSLHPVPLSPLLLLFLLLFLSPNRHGVCDASPRYSRKLSEVIIRRSSTSQTNEDLSSSAVSEEFARATIATYDSQQERNFLQRAAQTALMGQGQGQGPPPSSTPLGADYPTPSNPPATLSASTSAAVSAAVTTSHSDFRSGSNSALSLSAVDISGEMSHTLTAF